ncbi:MAG: glycosyltransferase family 4 protein [Actinomycetota bacterium]
MRDFSLRMRLPEIRDEVVILGFAPWDWRMAIYGRLARRNAVVYHTSWPYWETESVPRRYGLLNPALQNLWLRTLRLHNVHVVAVLDESRRELQDLYAIESTVIPHAVPEIFFAARRQYGVGHSGSLRLIFVGALWKKKGLEQILALMDSLRGETIELTIVGDGALQRRCIQAAASNPAIQFLGPIRDRAELAETMAAHDILVLLSQREPPWEELFGIVIAEGMAAGLGVIASNHIGPRSLLQEAGLGNLFDDDDLEGPLSLIRRLASHRTELESFRNAHSDLADRFRLTSVADQWHEVIDGAYRRLGVGDDENLS